MHCSHTAGDSLAALPVVLWGPTMANHVPHMSVPETKEKSLCTLVAQPESLIWRLVSLRAVLSYWTLFLLLPRSRKCKVLVTELLELHFWCYSSIQIQPYSRFFVQWISWREEWLPTNQQTSFTLVTPKQKIKIKCCCMLICCCFFKLTPEVLVGLVTLM